MTRVAEDDRFQSTVGAVDTKNVNRVVDRAHWNECGTPVRGKISLALRVRQLRRLESRHGLSDERRKPVLELRCIRADISELRGGQSIRDRQLFINDRTAMGVARIEQNIRASKATTPLNQRGDTIGHTRRYAEEICGDQNRGRLIPALERQRLCMQWQGNSLRRLRTGGETSHPERAIGSYVDRRRSRAPGLGRARRCSRRSANCGECGQEVATMHGLEPVVDWVSVSLKGAPCSVCGYPLF